MNDTGPNDTRAARPDAQGAVHRATSGDGTTIAARVSGQGPPLVLVHGAGGAGARWAGVTAQLGERFTVFALDRRGRGASGDHAEHSLAREIEDVEAIMASIGELAHLLGHSYGGICALEAAPRLGNLMRLVIYEPPVPVPGHREFPDGFIERLQALVDAGERERAATMFLHEIIRMPAAELERLQASPVWPLRIAAAHTLPREFRAVEDYRLDAARLRPLCAPTLLLLGSDSPPRFSQGIEIVARALPHSRTVVLPGQQHNAMDTAPQLFVRTVLDFLAGPG